jgi:hypothetical protein
MPDEAEPTPPSQPPAGGAYTVGEKISAINVADEIKNSFLDYSMSVIISRALPDVSPQILAHFMCFFGGYSPSSCIA